VAIVRRTRSIRQRDIDVLTAHALLEASAAFRKKQVASSLNLDAALTGPAETSPRRQRRHRWIVQ
jgi:hypothetical protein